MLIDEDFKKHTKHHVSADGTQYSIDCKKGLWGVSAPTQEAALNEARHYFRQYWRDGEYSEQPHKHLLDAIR